MGLTHVTQIVLKSKIAATPEFGGHACLNPYPCPRFGIFSSPCPSLNLRWTNLCPNSCPYPPNPGRFFIDHFFGVVWRPWDRYQKIGYFLAHLLIYAKSLSRAVHPRFRPRKSWNMGFSILNRNGNRTNFYIFSNDFGSSTSWAIQSLDR